MRWAKKKLHKHKCIKIPPAFYVEGEKVRYFHCIGRRSFCQEGCRLLGESSRGLIPPGGERENPGSWVIRYCVGRYYQTSFLWGPPRTGGFSSVPFLRKSAGGRGFSLLVVHSRLFYRKGLGYRGGVWLSLGEKKTPQEEGRKKKGGPFYALPTT